ncbi:MULTISPECIES: tetratricopeptide repeat protein [Sphingobacterium]|uniref:Tetratricopeptide repeat protein n=1 Tax=Sphingobacterium kitahiroshimense TaxID=470446 RepID=A0ABV0BWS7_9SPHI|nr:MULTISPECIES: tetratricopeptide repeat protein [unclassified Sphingobacterium]MBB2953610.1 tetratricopeptide (TPR) repeat protein [Sphingobacterium sp. JUb56]MCS3554826.1 tetratricopeptide (TPR) repeat protein [Sphingobacterium sp. JUb21]
MFKKYLKYALLVTLLTTVGQRVSAQESKQEKPYSQQLKNIEVFLRNGDFKQAMDSLDAITTRYPNADDAYFTKAVLFGQMRNADRALEEVNKALEINPKNEYLSFNIDVNKGKGDLPSAIRSLDLLMTKEKVNIAALNREKIMLLFNSDKKDEAFALYKDVRERAGATDTLDVIGATLLLSKDDFPAVIQVLEPWAIKKSPLAQVYSQLAQAYRGIKDPKKAIAILNTGVANAKDDYLFLDLADEYRLSGKAKLSYDYLKQAFLSKSVDFSEKNRIILSLLAPNSGFSFDQAQELANILVDVHPRVAESHVAKGQVNWMRNDLVGAQSSFSIAVGINPYQIDAWRMLMNVDLALEQYDQAIEHGGEALHNIPNNPVILYFSSIAYTLKGNYDLARNLMEAALNNGQNENAIFQSNIYSGLGDIYHSLKMEAASDVAYREAINLDSTNVSAMNNLAYYLALRNQDLDDAAHFAETANKLRPNDATLEDTYAWVLFKQGKYADALLWIEKAIKNSKSPSTVLLEHYGDILIKNKKITEAMKQWKSALARGGSSETNMEKLREKINKKSYVE